MFINLLLHITIWFCLTWFFILINISLIEKIKDKTQLDKLSEEMIEQLFTKKVYSNEEKNYLIKLKSIKKHKPVVNKKSMWKPKKKKGVQKKAVSL